MTKQTFNTAQEVRDFFAGFGFDPFRKGLTQGSFKNGRYNARFSYRLLSKTGQSSRGAAAHWGYVAVVEEVGR